MVVRSIEVNRQTVCSLRLCFKVCRATVNRKGPVLCLEQFAYSRVHAGMLREGDYGVFYQRACQRAAGDSPPGVRPLEFTHVMIDEAGQASVHSCGAGYAVMCICHIMKQAASNKAMTG